MKRLALVGGLIVLVMVALFLAWSLLFRAPDSNAQDEIFTIAPGTEEQTPAGLVETGFVNNTWVFNLAMTIKSNKDITPGGFAISKSMGALGIIDVLTTEPDMKWVVIPEGLRKEEIGERLAETLGWSSEELVRWNQEYTTASPEYIEGVYFPDTYLIPVNESGIDIAKRMQRRFNEQFAPYFDQFAEQNIIWTTGLRLASVIQREAAGTQDMALISGILWNRLLQDQKLELDATVQYARGKTDEGWWAPITPQDIETIDSPFNTYKYPGLPPHPISNPGIAAIEAVLQPEETDCFFYLHDNTGQIHCGKTYDEHLQNIEQYLR